MHTLIDDVGSFPLPKNVNKDIFTQAYLKAREAIINRQDFATDEFVQKNFCEVVVNSFRKKLLCGLDVVTFPQQFSGLRQIGDAVHEAMAQGSFIVEDDKAVLPEIYVLNRYAKELSEEFNRKILLRVCLFGPLEQYLHEVGAIAYPDVLEGFAETINRFAKNAILNSKYIETRVISIDEPSYGHTNLTATPELVVETLQKAYNFHGPTRQIHLHSTSGIHHLLNVKNLDVLSFEYAASPRNIYNVSKDMLEAADKQIRVGIARTDIDALWAEICEKGVEKPTDEQLVEPVEIIHKRYLYAKEKYGELLTFTGPDCGLGSWPNQNVAAMVLKRTVEAVKQLGFI
jgi:5-methyltetrahydropteroyltriglutamate--homocysteine methyltransferase